MKKVFFFFLIFPVFKSLYLAVSRDFSKVEKSRWQFCLFAKMSHIYIFYNSFLLVENGISVC